MFMIKGNIFVIVLCDSKCHLITSSKSTIGFIDVNEALIEVDFFPLNCILNSCFKRKHVRKILFGTWKKGNIKERKLRQIQSTQSSFPGMFLHNQNKAWPNLKLE